MTTVQVDTAERMEQLGRTVAAYLRAGDVVVLHGSLGAGKTTFSRGFGEGLQVEGVVQSPTFVVARTHPRQDSTLPALVHIDAYRLNHSEELVDLDVDYDHSIVLIEWGRPHVEHVATEWLDVDISAQSSAQDDSPDFADNRPRVVTLSGHTRSGEPSIRFTDALEALDDFGH